MDSLTYNYNTLLSYYLYPFDILSLCLTFHMTNRKSDDWIKSGMKPFDAHLRQLKNWQACGTEGGKTWAWPVSRFSGSAMSWLRQESSCVGAGLSWSNQVACNFGTLELVRFLWIWKSFHGHAWRSTIAGRRHRSFWEKRPLYII